jgi:hypothetical protein
MGLEGLGVSNLQKGKKVQRKGAKPLSAPFGPCSSAEKRDKRWIKCSSVSSMHQCCVRVVCGVLALVWCRRGGCAAGEGKENEEKKHGGGEGEDTMLCP